MLTYHPAAFQLPEGVADSLEYSPRTSVPDVPLPEDTASNDLTAQDSKTLTTTATACTLCTLNFQSPDEQRRHVRSDLHCYNLKQKLRGQKAVSETEFETLIRGLTQPVQ